MKEYNYRFLAYLGTALALGLMAVLGVFGAVQPERMSASAMALQVEAVRRGAEIYAQDCATCHGSRGEGVRNTGPALNTREFLAEASDALIFDTIVDGRPGTAMPAWGQPRGGPYNAQAVNDLVAFIRAWEPTAPSSDQLVIEGDPLEGAFLFATTCYACHGVSGEGTATGLRLNDRAKLAQYDDRFYRDAIARGRPERGMPTWGSVLSPVQIEDLVAYIRSWETEVPAVMASLGGDTGRGEVVFDSVCIACHGPAGGGTNTAPPLAEAEVLGDLDTLYTTISQGRLDAGMPAWGQVLSPAEINDVVAYLRTLKAGAAPGGNVASGARLYATSCVTCHGLSGEGVEGLGPSLRPSDFVAVASDAVVADIIMRGAAHGEMPGQAGLLSAPEVNDIIALLRSWQRGTARGAESAAQANFARLCGRCHGQAGEGGDAPPLVDNEIVQSADDQTILNLIQTGDSKTGMPPFRRKLSEEEILAIIQVLRSWQ